MLPSRCIVSTYSSIRSLSSIIHHACPLSSNFPRSSEATVLRSFLNFVLDGPWCPVDLESYRRGRKAMGPGIANLWTFAIVKTVQLRIESRRAKGELHTVISKCLTLWCKKNSTSQCDDTTRYRIFQNGTIMRRKENPMPIIDNFAFDAMF